MINLYPNCIPIIGHTQIAIYDLEKQCAKTVPKEDFFNPNGSVTNPFFEKDQLRVEAEKWLFDNHFLMPVQDNEILQLLKPSSYKNWKSPARITNAVIEPTTVNGLLDAANFRKFLSFLQPLLCNHIFVKITELVSLKVLKDVIESFDGTTIQSVELLVMYQPDFYTDEFAELILNQQRIRFVIIQASPFEKNIEEKMFFTATKLLPITKKKKSRFITNVHLFSESQLHHTYFNRKLSIGPEGEIKNAPECESRFGFIQDIQSPAELMELIESASFQKYWYVSKGLCAVCKDCEFKHMCVDNRVPQQHEDGTWFHLEKCNYDPYTGEWEED